MNDAAVVERLVKIAPKVIQHAYTRARVIPKEDCCLLGRVCHDALEHLGITSEPIDAFATAWNAKFNEWLKTGGDPSPQAYRTTNDPRVLAKAGIEAPATGVKSHVVIHVPSTRQIIDLAAWQLAHPEHGLQLPGAICLSWNGEKALFESPTGWVGYRPCLASMFKLPPPFPQRDEWLKARSTSSWLSKVLAKKVRRKPR